MKYYVSYHYKTETVEGYGDSIVGVDGELRLVGQIDAMKSYLAAELKTSHNLAVTAMTFLVIHPLWQE
jgi:hypothetical protein